MTMRERLVLLKEKDKIGVVPDYREGLAAVLSILVPEERRSLRQTITARQSACLSQVDSIVSDKLTFFL